MAKNITKVPNGPLIKKKGPFKGSTLKAGGKIKKAQNGDTLTVKKPWQRMTLEEKSAKKKELIKQGGIERFIQYKDSVSSAAEERRNAAFAKGAAMRGMTTAEYSKYLKRSNRRPDAPLEGLETSKACKRGDTKGSCSTGSSNRGESLRDTRRNGGPVKKAQNGGSTTTKPNYSNMKTTKRSFFKDKPYTPTAIDSSYYRQGFDMATKGKSSIPAYDMKTKQGLRGYEEATKRGLNPKKKPKAKAGAMIKRAQNGESFTKDGNEYTYTKQVTRPEGKRKYEGKSKDQATAMKIANFKIRNNPSDSLRTVKPVIRKNGGLIKRADGSYSKRGLWDNIRANKGSGKKPTKQMLQQEKKIKAKSKK